MLDMKAVVVALALPLALTACGGPSPDGAFASDVHPVLVLHCGGCHSQSAVDTSEHGPGMFGDENLAVAFSEAQAYVEVGDPAASPLYQRVSSDPPTMPPLGDNPLDASELESLRAWIAAGATGD